MATLFQLLRTGAIHPVVIQQLPLAAASETHARIDRGGLGGKLVLMPWSEQRIVVRVGILWAPPMSAPP